MLAKDKMLRGLKRKSWKASYLLADKIMLKHKITMILLKNACKRALNDLFFHRFQKSSPPTQGHRR